MATTQEKKAPVEESVKTRKTREKLRKRLDALEKKITPQALKEKVIEIHRWIALNAGHRVLLRTKEISLFDENQNTADVSRKITGIADQIQKDIDKSYLERKDMDSDGILKKLIASSRDAVKVTN
jgi:hypothetical protein